MALLAPATAFAIIGGEGVDPNTVDSPWAGVGSILRGGETFSGTLIAPGYVLTAAHAVAGAADNPSAVTFQINAGAITQIQARKIYVNPNFTGIADAYGLVHGDLAIIRLSDAAPSNVPYYSLHTSTISAGTRLVLVGYGEGGDGINGATILRDPTVKRTAQNNADRLLPYSANRDIYLFDFDGAGAPNLYGGATLGADVEGTVGGGDSGGGAFVFDNGVWKLAGVNTFMGSAGKGAPGYFGSIGGGILLSAESAWVNSVIAPVPEPQTWLMLLPGLLGISGLAIRHRKNSALSNRTCSGSKCR